MLPLPSLSVRPLILSDAKWLVRIRLNFQQVYKMLYM